MIFKKPETMKNIFFSLLILFPGLTAIAQEKPEIPSKEIQMKTAALAAPEEDREAVSILGYDENGEMMMLREGTNNLICLADDPGKEGISVSCYNKKLEPFMARGRALKAEGKSLSELREIRKKEVEAGTLIMPDAPSMLYVLTGDKEDYNPETGELAKSFLRYVIYTPFATTEETGLPDKPHAPGMPWLMDPGTHRAHIMITPPMEEEKMEKEHH